MKTLREYSIEITLILALAASIGFFGYLGYGLVESEGDVTFSGESALGHVEKQLAFGPRITGTAAHKKMGDWLIQELSAAGWDVFIQPFEVADGIEARNIIALRGQGPVAVLGAHYDTRMLADEDPDPALRDAPVPGANDGASGVAVLLELARTLNTNATDHTVCMVFFDAEDNGRIPGWDWILGSQYFVSKLEGLPQCNPPEFAVVVDMVGDADQQIYRERNSTPPLTTAIWTIAENLGYDEWFIDESRYRMIDDHTPFLEAEIPAVDVIDFDYPYWHTTDDTLDKVSADSLARVGRTLEVWLEMGAPFQK